MNSELPVSADALLAERARLEEVLQSSEDWCELLRLKSRKDRGEGMSAVNAARLEMVLIDALAEDEDFIRYKAVCVALERLIRGLPPLPPKGEKPPVEKDDLTEIDGITASMQRRLNALDVTTFMQIAEWSPADVKSISSDLGIGRQIYEQDWIGQAEELATRSDTPPPPPAPKYVAPQRPVAPPPPPSRPVETRAPPVEKPAPQIVREPPRPVVEAKAEAKPVEVKAEPIAAKPVPPVAPKIEPKSDDVAQPATQNKAQSADPVAAKPEPKSEPKTDTPSQTTSTKNEPKDQSAAPSSASSSAPLADPPRPLKPETYRGPAVDADAKADAKSDARNDASAQLLPMPPSPLRVQPPAATSQQPGKTATPAATPVQLGTPPKPFVITRASLPPLPKAEPPPAPPAAQRQPEPPRLASSASAPAAKPESGPFAALAALKTAPAAPPSTAPSMSIAEAIAYAAEVARQSPKTPSNIPPGNAAAKSAPANVPPPQKLEPARPPAAPAQTPQAQTSPAQTPAPPKPAAAAPAPARPPVQAVPAKPAVPPPLPDGFVPPPEETETEHANYGNARGPASRNGARDDAAGQRMYAEEATVEIVVKSAPELVATPRAALTKVATDTAANTPRPATPIGRFLKALTGN